MPKPNFQKKCTLTDDLVIDSCDARAHMKELVSERRDAMARWHEWAAKMGDMTHQRIDSSMVMLARIDKLTVRCQTHLLGPTRVLNPNDPADRG